MGLWPRTPLLPTGGGGETVTGPGGTVGAVTGPTPTWSLAAGNWYDCAPNVGAVTLNITGWTAGAGDTGIIQLRPTIAGILTVQANGVTIGTYSYSANTPALLSVSSDDGGTTVALAAGLAFGTNVYGPATTADGLGVGTTGDTNPRVALGSDALYMGPGNAALNRVAQWSTNIGAGVGGLKVTTNLQVSAGGQHAFEANISMGGTPATIDVGAVNSGWHTIALQSGGGTGNALAVYNNGLTAIIAAIDATGGLHPGNTTALGPALWAGTGAPAAGLGNNGDIYFRSDGGALTTIYQKRAGAWAGIV